MRQILGVLSKEMIESIVEKYLRTSQGWIVNVKSFLEEEALSSHHNKSHQEALNPSLVTAKCHCQVNF